LNIEWVYEETQNDDFIEAETESVLKPAPELEIEALFDLAMRGDMRGILNRAKHIDKMGKEYGPFATKLRNLAEQFEEKKILTLVQAYKDMKDENTFSKSWPDRIDDPDN